MKRVPSFLDEAISAAQKRIGVEPSNVSEAKKNAIRRPSLLELNYKSKPRISLPIHPPNKNSWLTKNIQEDNFENRYMHVSELNRMGAKILIKGNKAFIEGNIKFTAAELMATDLRASVSLILAALTTRGKSIINRIYHLDRGYENIEKKLKRVGAKIRRVN